MLKIRGLDFGFSGRLIFKDLSLDVAAGEHVVIVGDSGGGKSTLLKLIADNEQAAIKLNVGANSTMVMQEGALLDHLNVIDNLRLVARYAHHSISDAQISDTLSNLNIDSSLYGARVNQLSGGQLRRVAIARALLTSPQVILFDEPDAGLDIVNLSRLANTVSILSQEQGKACMTVSHNPFYIAQVATKVYRLQGGQLTTIADWPAPARGQAELQERQLTLQGDLSVVIDAPAPQSAANQPRDWVVASWVKGLGSTLRSLVHAPRSIRDELSIAAYGVYLSFITGALFFALVGIMLGSTTIAVVKMLADNTLTGFLTLFIKPETLVDMMGGRYVLYLAPAIGGMLFAARSGSIMCNWLGEMVRGRQVLALRLLDVPPQQYLAAPSTFAVFISMFASISWFALCVWFGGVIATQQMFEIANPVEAMRVTSYDISVSLFWLKTTIYSALVALTVVSLGLAPKTSAHQVSIHTTKTIIYSTLSIVFAELLIILT